MKVTFITAYITEVRAFYLQLNLLTRAASLTTLSMAWVFTLQKQRLTKVSTKTVRNTDMEHGLGLTQKNLRERGKMI